VDIGWLHILHSRIFPLIIISYISVAFSFYVPRERTVSRARNKPHSVSLLSFSLSLSLSLGLLPSLAILSTGGGKTNTFPQGCVLKKRFQWKSNSHEETMRGMKSSKYHLDSSIIAFPLPVSPIQQNRLVNPFKWLLLHSFRDSYSQCCKNIRHCNFSSLKKHFNDATIIRVRMLFHWNPKTKNTSLHLWRE